MAANVIDLGNPSTVSFDNFYLEPFDTYTGNTAIFTIRKEGGIGGFGTISCDLNREETMESGAKSVPADVLEELKKEALRLGAFFRKADGLDPYQPMSFWERLKRRFWGDLEFDEEE